MYTGILFLQTRKEQTANLKLEHIQKYSNVQHWKDESSKLARDRYATFCNWDM